MVRIQRLKVWQLFFVLLLFGCASFESKHSDTIETRGTASSEASPTLRKALVVLTLDGTGYNQLLRIDPSIVTQWHIQPIRPPVPSLTFPGHATIATGVIPAFHKIKDNNFKAAPSEMQWKPMWTEAAQKGLRVRTYQYPLSYGPWNGIEHNYDKVYEPFDYRIGFVQIKNKVLAELNNWDRKEDFLFIARTPALDDFGHTYGPYAPETANEWEKTKQQIIEFESALENMDKSGIQILVIFVADHGMAEIDQCGPSPCRYRRKNGDRGFHGADPAVLSDMLGVFWTFPRVNIPVPKCLVNLKSFAWTYLGLEDDNTSEISPDMRARWCP